MLSQLPWTSIGLSDCGDRAHGAEAAVAGATGGSIGDAGGTCGDARAINSFDVGRTSSPAPSSGCSVPSMNTGILIF